MWQNDLVSILVCLHSLPHLTVTSPLLMFSQGISSREDRDDLVRSSSHTPSNKAQILAMPQFGLRDNLIRCELLKNEDLYTYLEDFRYVLFCLLCPFCICFENVHVWQDVELGDGISLSSWKDTFFLSLTSLMLWFLGWGYRCFHILFYPEEGCGMLPRLFSHHAVMVSCPLLTS